MMIGECGFVGLSVVRCQLLVVGCPWSGEVAGCELPGSASGFRTALPGLFRGLAPTSSFQARFRQMAQRLVFVSFCDIL